MADKRRHTKLPSSSLLEYRHLHLPLKSESPVFSYTWVPLIEELHYNETNNIESPYYIAIFTTPHYTPIGTTEPAGQTWTANVNSFTTLFNPTDIEPIAVYKSPTSSSPSYLREGTDGKYRYYMKSTSTDYFVLSGKEPSDLGAGEIGVGRHSGHETLFITNNEGEVVEFQKYNGGNGINIIGTEINAETKQSITIAGWSGQVGSGVYSNGDTIPAGTSIETILKNLLSRITWPTPTYTYTWSLTNGNPTLTNSRNYAANAHVPVGTSLTMTGAYNAPTANRKGVISAMTYGYSTTPGGTLNTSTSFTTNYTTSASGDYTVTLSFTGFTGATSATTTTNSSNTSGTLYVANGTNTCNCSTESRSYSAATTPTTTLYPASSGMSSDSTHTAVLSNANALAALSNWNTALTVTKSASLSLVGYWPYYHGFVTSTITSFTSDIIKSLAAKETIPTSDTTTAPSGSTGGSIEYILAVPSTRTSDYNKTTMSVINAVNGSSFSSGSSTTTVTVKDASNIGTLTYKVFYMIAAEGTTSATQYNISLS